MRQLFPGLNISHGHEDDLPLHADIGVARVIAEDHSALPLVFGEGTNKEAIGYEYFRWSEGSRNTVARGTVKDVAALDRYNFIFCDWRDCEQPSSMDGTFSDRRLWREVG